MAGREIGLVQPFDGSPSFGAAYAKDFAQAAESVGFHSVWVPEHIVFFQRYGSVYPYPPEPGSAASPQLPVGRRPALFDPLLTCQALALHTTTLRVGTAVALVPLRHPLLWAREISTLDHFSGGRFELGVGVGWLAEEYAALGASFADRGRVADEHLAALRTIWTTEDSTFHGRHVDFTDAVSLPDPLQQPGPPVLVGGHSEAALRRVARHGDGWFAWNLTPDELEQGLVRLDAHLGREVFADGRARTRDDVAIQIGFRCLGSLDDLAGLVDAYAAAGATRIVAAVPIRPAELDARLGAIAGALDV